MVLNASASTDPDGDALQYRWDFEGDGTWDMDWGPDAVVTHTWGDDFGADPVVEVRDGEFTSTATAHVIVYNVAPSAEVTIQLAGDEGVTGGIAYSIHITDPGSDEIDFHMTFGDGTGETSFVDCHPICPDPYPSPDVDPADTVASGTKYYGDNGVFEIHILITDDDGGVGSASLGVTVTTWALQPDSWHPGQTALVIGGTTGADRIFVNPGGGRSALKVTLNDGVFDGSFMVDLLLKNGLKLKMFKEEEIDLEDVFLAITKGITN